MFFGNGKGYYFPFFPSLLFLSPLEFFFSPFLAFPSFFCFSAFGEEVFFPLEADFFLPGGMISGEALSAEIPSVKALSGAVLSVIRGAGAGLAKAAVGGDFFSGIGGISGDAGAGAAAGSGMYSRISLISQFKRAQRVSSVWVDTCMFFFRRPICPALK